MLITSIGPKVVDKRQDLTPRASYDFILRMSNVRPDPHSFSNVGLALDRRIHI